MRVTEAKHLNYNVKRDTILKHFIWKYQLASSFTFLYIRKSSIAKNFVLTAMPSVYCSCPDFSLILVFSDRVQNETNTFNYTVNNVVLNFKSKLE